MARQIGAQAGGGAWLAARCVAFAHLPKSAGLASPAAFECRAAALGDLLRVRSGGIGQTDINIPILTKRNAGKSGVGRGDEGRTAMAHERFELY